MSTSFPKNTESIRLNPYKHAVALQTSRKRFAKFCKCCKEYAEDNGTAGVAQYCETSGMFYVGVFDGQLSTLAHECSHVVFMLFERVGMDARHDAGEAFCYLLAYMMREFGPTILKDAT